MEWLIDIIKEWVIAQAYATEAWVLAKVYATEAWMTSKLYLPKAKFPEYAISASVTGDIEPDVTCRYFRGGDLNDKPWYGHPNGNWFIWWDGIDSWYINDDLGVLSGGWWKRTDPDIEGTYPLRFIASGVPTVTLGSKYLINGSVDRGDPAAWDRTIVNFTADDAWHDLDLSAIVPAGAKSVLFLIYCRNDLINKDFYIRKKGNVNMNNMIMQRTEVAGLVRVADGECPCDENRFVQYYLHAGGWTRIRLTVKGWRF